jgi:CBS domain containing-hemolysin-like protein
MTQSDHSGPSSTDMGTERLGPGAKPSLLDRLRALFGLSGASIRDDIQDALEDTSSQADFSAQERTMMKNVLALHELRVVDVMVPRADIFAVALTMTLAEVLAMFRMAGHSRLPVHGETLDDPRGMIHVRDLVDYIASAEEPVDTVSDGTPDDASGLSTDRSPRKLVMSLGALDLSLPLSAAKILRPVLFVPPSMPALDLLVKMQTTRTHMALVIDEYGGTDGLVSIEDIVEMIVGDIEDEHDLDDGPKIEASADGTFLVDARADLGEVSDVLGTDLAAMSDAEDFDTVGGLVTTLAGHVPVRGEIIVEGGFEFEVLDADPRRIKRLKIYRETAAGGATEAIADSAHDRGGAAV